MDQDQPENTEPLNAEPNVVVDEPAAPTTGAETDGILHSKPPAEHSADPIFSDSEPQLEIAGSGSRDRWPESETMPGDPFIPIPYSPVSEGETIRRSGLAWSAGVAFFGSVAFMLFLGWLADLLLGTSPWGLIGGIVLGSILGFMQFFRITSRIFARRDDGPEISPLMSRKDSDEL